MAKNYHLHLKGFVGGWDFDSDYVDYVLDKNKDNQVDVLIDSLGGKTNTALSIYHAFKNHGNVHVHLAGMNASAATIVSMGAKTITMDRYSFYLVHKCSIELFKWVNANSDDLADLIEELQQQKENMDKFDYAVAEMYASRCKKSPSDLLELMKKGGWLTAQETKEWGFVDEVTELEEDQKPELSSAELKSLVEMGIPIPGKNESIFSRLFKSWTDYFTSNTKPSKTMKKILTQLGLLLSLEHFESTDGKVTLTDEQLDAIESALGKAKTDLAERDATIARLTNEVTTLQKNPGDDTDQVVTEDPNEDENNVTSFISTYNSAKELYDLIS